MTWGEMRHREPARSTSPHEAPSRPPAEGVDWSEIVVAPLTDGEHQTL